MATTFHVVNFKNKTLNLFSGTVTSTPQLNYVQPWNGTQPADPSVAPTGATEFPSTAFDGPALAGKIAAAGGGLATLSTSAPPNTPANAVALTGITFCRLFDLTATAPLIDTTASLAGGGGGVILNSLTSVAGVGNTVIAFSFKMPSSLNTLLLSQALANRLVDMWCTSGTPPQFGNNVGGGSAITLYSGAIPATADAAAGTVLATYNMTATQLWNAASGGGMSLAAAGPAVTASATGTATYFRMTKTLGAVTLVFQGTVGTVSGASDMILNTVALTSGVTSVQITDFTISI